MTNSKDLEKHAAAASNLLKSMANQNRLMILCALVDGELNVTELNDIVPLSQSALSQHLAALRTAGLVQVRKEAQSVYYALKGNEAVQVITVLKNIFCPDKRKR